MSTTLERASGGEPAEPPVMFCANHPETETLLRCNRCDKPICVKCAVQTPVGYRCKECVREQQDVYYNAKPGDNLIALGVAFGVTVVATPLVALGFRLSWIFSFIIALAVGGAAGAALAGIIRKAVGRRRGRNMRWFALAGIIGGVLVGSLIAIAILGINPLTQISMWIFLGLMIASALPFLR